MVPERERSSTSTSAAEARHVHFTLTDEPEAHRIRRRDLIRRYPRIRDLMGHDTRTAWVTVGVFVAQLAIAYAVGRGAASLSIGGRIALVCLSSYGIGAVLAHWLGQTIHETSHRLVFKTWVANRALALFANVPMILPIAMTFHRYHVGHHQLLNVDGFDTDLPLPVEVRAIGNRPWRKLLWLSFYLFVYAARGATFARLWNKLEWLNFLIQMLANVVLYRWLGADAFAFLCLATFFGHSLHPVAAHFIHEHYVFAPDQETNSYYGPLNLVTFNVGYHVEHHDFMNIPGRHLPKLRALAPSFYDGLLSHRSWTAVLWHFIASREIGVGSRIVRRRPVDAAGCAAP